jgi:hypothetical protein|nr:MAG TPA: hypothetical protein [Caudoviricetes sp.]
MPDFRYLDQCANAYYINSRVPFSSLGTLNPDLVETVFDFAYQMTFGQSGEHRAHRTGGTHQRRNGEIFANTFQGKLAEYALFFVLTDNDINVSEPDLGIFGLGEWDSVDLIIGNALVSIKSTKSFGNLLLLEEHDWDEQANYLPNGHGYDYTFLIRMNPFCEDVMRKNRFLYSDSINGATLKQIIMAKSWTFDIPGYVTREDLIQIINGEYIIPCGSMLNGKTRMDATNYYIQSGDLRDLNSFIRERK